jgi:hypothetical protein
MLAEEERCIENLQLEKWRAWAFYWELIALSSMEIVTGNNDISVWDRSLLITYVFFVLEIYDISHENCRVIFADARRNLTCWLAIFSRDFLKKAIAICAAFAQEIASPCECQPSGLETQGHFCGRAPSDLTFLLHEPCDLEELIPLHGRSPQVWSSCAASRRCFTAKVSASVRSFAHFFLHALTVRPGSRFAISVQGRSSSQARILTTSGLSNNRLRKAAQLAARGLRLFEFCLVTCQKVTSKFS